MTVESTAETNRIMAKYFRSDAQSEAPDLQANSMIDDIYTLGSIIYAQIMEISQLKCEIAALKMARHRFLREVGDYHRVAAEDVEMLSGEPEPLVIMHEVTIEEDNG